MAKADTCWLLQPSRTNISEWSFEYDVSISDLFCVETAEVGSQLRYLRSGAKTNTPLALPSDFNPFNATRCVVEVDGVVFWRSDLSLSLQRTKKYQIVTYHGRVIVYLGSLDVVEGNGVTVTSWFIDGLMETCRDWVVGLGW